jgi:hypothetical protein
VTRGREALTAEMVRTLGGIEGLAHAKQEAERVAEERGKELMHCRDSLRQATDRRQQDKVAFEAERKDLEKETEELRVARDKLEAEKADLERKLRIGETIKDVAAFSSSVLCGYFKFSVGSLLPGLVQVRALLSACSLSSAAHIAVISTATQPWPLSPPDPGPPVP